jgi:hypothetical protein
MRRCRRRCGIVRSRLRECGHSPLGRCVAGAAVTAQCAAGDNLMMHKVPQLAMRGDVLVVSGHNGGISQPHMLSTWALRAWSSTAASAMSTHFIATAIPRLVHDDLKGGVDRRSASDEFVGLTGYG